MQAQYLDIVANNLANVNTSGFKGDDLRFGNELVQAQRIHGEGAYLEQEEAPIVTNLDRREQNYARVEGQWIDWSQGPLKQTGNPLDVAVEGNGFLLVSLNGQTFYTREGSLRMNGDGTLIHSSGGTVLDANRQPIRLEPSQATLNIDRDGRIYQGESEVGRLGVVEVADRHRLIKAGHTLFAPSQPGLADHPSENSVVHQGFLEGSNVSPVREMVKMIQINRDFETMNKAIKAYRDLDTQSMQEIGNITRMS